MMPDVWVRSSYSYANGNCVEAAWRKSSHSKSGNCPEAGPGACGMVHVRDSKDRQGPQLTVTPAAWEAFTRAIKAGEFAL